MTTETAPGPTPAEPLRVTCPECGAQTVYAPGTTTLRCPACHHEQHIDSAGRTVVEHSYDEWAALPAKPVATIGTQVLQCRNCGAQTETDLLADTCHFCRGPLVAMQSPERLVVPEAVVAFRVDKVAADAAVNTWVKSRRFAPSGLKKINSDDAMNGTYVPHWTYDAQTRTDYTGERGEHYWTTETYTVSDGQGGTRTETRQVQHTRWYDARGQVSRDFDDVLVPASHRLPAQRLEQMGPWTLASAEPFQPEYLAGYTALRYDVDPDAGLAVARGEMEDVVRGDCEHDIGGDLQRVRSIDVHYAAMMFKLVLLPLWIASYVYAGTSYQVLVNANTGEVVGDRPYSKIKIAALSVLIAAVIAAVIILIVLTKRK